MLSLPSTIYSLPFCVQEDSYVLSIHLFVKLIACIADTHSPMQYTLHTLYLYSVVKVQEHNGIVLCDTAPFAR